MELEFRGWGGQLKVNFYPRVQEGVGAIVDDIAVVVDDIAVVVVVITVTVIVVDVVVIIVVVDLTKVMFLAVKLSQPLS